LVDWGEKAGHFGSNFPSVFWARSPIGKGPLFWLGIRGGLARGPSAGEGSLTGPGPHPRLFGPGGFFGLTRGKAFVGPRGKVKNGRRARFGLGEIWGKTGGKFNFRAGQQNLGRQVGRGPFPRKENFPGIFSNPGGELELVYFPGKPHGFFSPGEETEPMVGKPPLSPWGWGTLTGGPGNIS